MNRRAAGRVLVIAMIFLSPVAAGAQTTVVATSPVEASGGFWMTVGGAATTLRGDCGECDLDAPYLHTGSLVSDIGFRVNSRMDAGVEVLWAPVTNKAGDHIRTTFILAAAEFRPLASRGFFLKVGMGMGFVRNFVYDPSGELPPYTSKALGVAYSAGWTFLREKPLAFQIFGSQQVAALGDLTTGGVLVENIVGNFWSIGAGVVIRGH